MSYFFNLFSLHFMTSSSLAIYHEAEKKGQMVNQISGGDVGMLIKLKSCPRCNGDLFINWDQHGQYVECLQCGYQCELRSQPDMKQRLAEREKASPSRLLE
jgi:Zn ribbon nucleic-acid-binding protein